MFAITATHYISVFSLIKFGNLLSISMYSHKLQAYTYDPLNSTLTFFKQNYL